MAVPFRLQGCEIDDDAADGYARLKRLGVAVVTSGHPGLG